MKRGFTLVELLIVVSISVTILGMGIASFNRFNRRERLKQAAQTLKTNLRLIQTKSISAMKPVSGCTTYIGIRLTFSADSYTARAECDPEGLVGSTDTFVLPTAITFQAAPAYMTFRTQSVVDLAADQTILLSNGTETYGITVSTNAQINDGGFQ